MGDLREQLMKAGLVSEGQVKKTKRKERKRSKAVGHRAVEREKQAAKQRVSEKLEQQRKADQERGRTERDADEERQRALRAAQIAESNRLPGRVRGPRRWYYLDGRGRVPFLELADAVAAKLERGQAALVADPQSGATSLVSRDGALRLREIEPQWVLVLNRAPQDK